MLANAPAHTAAALAVGLVFALGSARPAAAQDWAVLPIGTTQDLQEVFLDQFGLLWVVGDAGTVFRSPPARTSFARIDVPTTARLTSFVSPSSNVYETGGQAGAFYVSSNGTTGWVSRPIPDTSQDYVISTSASDTAIALGSAGRLYRTANNGRNWTEQSVPTAVPLNWALGESVIVGDDGVLLVFSGAVWEQRPTGVSANLLSVASGGTGTLVIVGEGGTILRSGGGSVTVRTSGTTAALRDVATSGQNASFLVAVGDRGTVLKTTDSGVTWCRLNTGTTVDLLGVAMVGNAEFIAVGKGGLVIRTTTGGGTCLPPVAAEDVPGPSAFMLSAAPSPASSLVTLSFTLAQPEPARLTVHDALGRTVAVVTDAPLTAGAHTAQLDTRRLAPGLYLVRLVTDAGGATAHLVVTR